MSAEKDRVRLTVYIDSELERHFRAEADSMYRNLSDHANAILADRFGEKGKSAGPASGGLAKGKAGR